MAIEISPKTKIEVPSWAIISALVCLVLILALGASYFYLEYRIKKISQEIEAKETEFIPLEKAISEKQAELSPLEQKINKFSVLIAEHKDFSFVFKFLEEICLPNVWFSDFSLSMEESRIFLSGSTETFVDLENQVSALSQREEVQSVSLSEAEISEERGVFFALNIIFNPSIFK